jgi:predicted RNase H-like nuclease (RuvC/YqgF family)
MQSATLARMATEKRALAMAESKKAADAKEMGVTDSRIRSINERVRAMRNEAAAMDAQVKNLDKGTAAMVAQIREYDRMASELERTDRLHRSTGHAILSSAAALATIGVAFVGASAVAGYFFVSAFKNWQEYQRQVALVPLCQS